MGQRHWIQKHIGVPLKDLGALMTEVEGDRWRIREVLAYDEIELESVNITFWLVSR